MAQWVKALESSVTAYTKEMLKTTTKPSKMEIVVFVMLFRVGNDLEE